MIGRVFVSRAIPRAGLDRLAVAGAEVHVWSGAEQESPPREDLLAGARRANVLLSLLTEVIDRKVMLASPDLLGIANYAVGFDNVDVGAATELGLPVSNTPGVLTETTADLAWALLLAVARNVVPGDAMMRAGGYRLWSPEMLLGEDVSPGGDGRRKVLGIVGFGRIGQAVARRAAGFDMEVLAYGPDARERIQGSGLAAWAALPDLLAHADFVSIHARLTPRTRHLIGEAELADMKPTAYLVNTSRGPVVDEVALVAALRGGRIAGAGLDVYEDEPRMAPGLSELPNTVLLPHLGSSTRGTRDRMAIVAADNALAMLRLERAPNCVNSEVYRGAPYRERVARRRLR